MYPQTELTLLALEKRALLDRIRARREDFSGQVAEALRPIMWVDWLYAKWREFSPAIKSMAAPLGDVVKQKLSLKTSPGVGRVFRWMPLAFTFFRSIR
jgi:hypothetical protein